MIRVYWGKVDVNFIVNESDVMAEWMSSRRRRRVERLFTITIVQLQWTCTTSVGAAAVVDKMFVVIYDKGMGR